MTPVLRVVAVVLAGGVGARVGLHRPKQLLKVAGRPVIVHAVAALQACPEIDEIVVVMAPEFIAEAGPLLLQRPDLSKVTRIVPGGADRNASTRLGLAAIADDECFVLVHDAVRPLLPPRVVTACVEALRTHDAVDVAIPSADTIIRVDDDDHIVDIPDRSYLRRGQTPQAFRLSTIRRAYELAAADPAFAATDDCGVVLKYLPEVPIHVVAGDEQNMKVTFPIDLFLLDKLFQLGSDESSPAPESVLRERLAGRTVVVLGGSYGIGREVADQAGALGCRVFSHSRTTTGTHVEAADTVAAAIAEAEQATGRVDAVVVTAAQLLARPLVEQTETEITQQVAVNLLGAVNAARAAAPALARTGGHLVLFTSSSYTRGRANYALYSATKAAVVNLAQALADEWAADGVHVNVVNPERTRTPMRERAFGVEPGETLLDSGAVAATVLDILASGATGQVFDVRRDDPAGTSTAAGTRPTERQELR